MSRVVESIVPSETKNDIIAKNSPISRFSSTQSTLIVIHSSIEDIHKRMCSGSWITFSLEVPKHNTPETCKLIVPLIVAPFLLESALSPYNTLSFVA